MSRSINTKKHRQKAPAAFKRVYRRLDRARANQAVREGKEYIPVRPHNDTWNWN